MHWKILHFSQERSPKSDKFFVELNISTRSPYVRFFFSSVVFIIENTIGLTMCKKFWFSMSTEAKLQIYQRSLSEQHQNRRFDQNKKPTSTNSELFAGVYRLECRR